MMIPSFSHAPTGWRILHASAVVSELNNPGHTNETALRTISIPGGAMGANGLLRVTTAWSATNSGNSKTCRVRLGGIAGTEFMINAMSTAITYRDQRIIANMNSLSSQRIILGAGTGGWGNAGVAEDTATQDTSGTLSLVISGQLATSTERVSLLFSMVELFYQA